MPSRVTLSRVAIHATLIAFAAFFLVPLVVVVLNSLRSTEEIAHGGVIGLPHELMWSNFSGTWSSYCIAQHCDGIQPYFWNSMRMVIPATIISTLLGALNGYSLSLWRFRGGHRVRHHDAWRVPARTDAAGPLGHRVARP
jgi:glucose/mannose transport system permease protein